MFDTNKKSFELQGNYDYKTANRYKFKTYDDELFTIYLDNYDGFVEVLFDAESYSGFDRLTADGFMAEKANTVAKVMVEYERLNSEDMKGFWWQATRQRFLYYEAFFKENQNMLDQFKYYNSVWEEDSNYGYAVLTKDPDLKIDENIIRFLT